MSGFGKLPQACSSDPEIDTHSTRRPPIRPKFHHKYTNDRIREGSGTPPTFSMISKIKKDRKSVFKELGLDDDEPGPWYTSEHHFGSITGVNSPSSTTTTRASRRALESDSDGDGDGEDRRSETEKPGADEHEQQSECESTQSATTPSASSKPWYTKLAPGRRPRIKTVASAPPSTMSTRLSTTALLIAVVLPAFSYYNGRAQVSLSGVDAGVIRSTGSPIPALETRADSPTDVCARWAHQAAQLNGTLYVYGGQAKRTKDQTTDTWNNYFLTLDLTKSWDVSSPALKGLTQPDGPPKVAMGYLWNDYNNLFLYGGQFADNPFVEPASPVSTWRYAIKDKTWTEFKSPKTLKGNSSDPGDTYVQRSSEGAGLSVPELGMSWYFGGHLDLSTTPGWSNQIARVYLKSLLEFTHPGYTNDGVFALADGTGAGQEGAYRNITEGGLQKAGTDEDNSKFPERADGVLVFVPGWGEKGVLIGLAGGTNETFTDDLSVLDVYDIARSEWYHQETRGDPPSVRVNPCAVIASAPDASSFQIYVYGGQNLLPFGEQVQYSDMYILSIPAFTWIKVPSPHRGKPIPSPRAGHTCHLRDGQMIILGGYTSPTISGTSTQECDYPGIYVFDASTLQWTSEFSSLGDEHPPDLNPENSVLAGSYGYRVPALVADVIGGDENGGATVTQPAAGPATGGPFATGKSPAFTVTKAGSTATITRWGPGATATGPPGPPGSGGDDSSAAGGNTEKRTGSLIAAGVIAGLAGLAAAYLGYCAWIYRRQVRAYRSHLAVANRYPSAASSGALGGFGALFFGRKGSKESKKSSAAGSRYSKGSKGKRARYTSGMGDNEKRRIHLRDESRSTEGDYNDAYQQPRTSWAAGGGGGLPVPTEPRYMFDDFGYSGHGGGDLGSGSLRPPFGTEQNSGGTGQSGSGSGGRLSTGTRPPPVVGSWWADSSAGGSHGSGGTGTGTGTTASGARSPAVVGGDREKMGAVHFGNVEEDRRRISGESESSTEALLEGQEPSFFSVVLGPRRALRVVNGLEGLEHDQENDGDTEGEGTDNEREDRAGGRYSFERGREGESGGRLRV
ncbi:hypothetical protein V8F06_008252 [Rhypophila decipiens]